MFSAIFQWMGLGLGLPVHSRAEAESPAAQTTHGGKALASETQPTGTHRRRAVKSPAKKTAARPAAAPAKAVPVKAKTLMKKPPAPSKPPAKSPAATKTAKTSAVKATAKPAVKAPSKVAAPAAKKTLAATPIKKAAVAAKAAPVIPAKPPGKVSSKAPVSPVPKTAPAKPLAKAVTAPIKAAPAPPKAAPAPPPAPIVHASGIIKAVRPSSRLVQITVPSMAQSVASTAAKSSFLPTDSRDELHPLVPHAIKKDPKLAGNWKKKAPGDLSDAELIAMPDSEYMNDVQMAAFRLKLVALKTGILSNAGETTEHLREDTSVMPDPADRATIEEEHALELRTRDRERKLLKKIEQAISRIDANEYGYCDETGEPIGVGRLLARPTATLSLEAQQRRELKQKMFGD
jgi:DnaK suppressor protein